MKSVLVLFMLFFHFCAVSKEASMDRKVIDIENAIFSGRLSLAFQLTKQLGRSKDDYYKQRESLFYAKIAYLKGDLKMMNSFLPRIKDDFPDILYYKNIIYGHYLIENNQTTLGYESINKAIDFSTDIDDQRIQIDNLFSKLYLLYYESNRENKQTKTIENEAAIILEKLKKLESKMKLFEKSQFYAQTVYFSSRKDTASIQRAYQKLISFGKTNDFPSSIIIGSQFLASIEADEQKKIVHLNSALEQTSESQILLLNVSVYTSFMDHYEQKGDLNSAIEWGEKSVIPGNVQHSLYIDTYARLAALYEKKGDLKSALEYKKKDDEKYRQISLRHASNIREYLVWGLEKSITEKNELLDRNRKLIIGISAFSAVLLLLLYYVLSLDRKLKKAMVKINQSNAQTEMFSRILSHDLKAPMYTISNLVGYVLQDEKDLDFKSKSYLMAAKDAVENSNVLINNIMTFIKYKDNPITFSEVSIDKIMDSVKQNLKEQIAINEATIEVNGFPESIQVNEILSVQLVQNLVQNAIKYKQLDVAPIIKIQYGQQENGFTITIRDNGKGIPEEKKSTLMNAFEQDVYSSLDNGIGLGLAICSEIVKLHNGAMELSNISPTGVAVTMSFKTEESD